MPTLRDALSAIRAIVISPDGPPVEETAARAVQSRLARGATVVRKPGTAAGPQELRLAVTAGAAPPGNAAPASPGDWMMIRAAGEGGVEMLTGAEHLLYPLFSLAEEDLAQDDLTAFSRGRVFTPAFPRMRPAYDLFLTQHARTVRGFRPEEHFQMMARLGFSHAEVNGLAFPLPFETGPRGELLHRFYTYCPALDQFVTSRLNRGFYDRDYLQANLNKLKDNAALARTYGMRPGLVCFEPRSVPDELLQRYPVLRGARVDHPMRSFRPRFNLSVAHPVVREHYAEMMENLMHEVPSLDYISIWSNDSGAGFEYTSSLYVGRNGGGYVVREWLGGKDIAAAAAYNIIRFLKVLRDAGRTVNPAFRTLIRLEPFWEEHEYLWQQLEDGLDVEVSSLQTKGWDLSYAHPKYPEVPQIHGTALYSRFVAKEKPLMEELAAKGSAADIYFTPTVLWNHEPLLGIPFPRLVLEKLQDMAAQGVRTPCFYGGVTPGSFVPYDVNQELVRAFQLNPGLKLEPFLRARAAAWVGEEQADDLAKVWLLSDEAFRAFPVPIWIYAGWSVWYRLFVRPIVPNIEAVSESDRAYYEDFLLATTHNRTRVDFRYDVGFDLIEPERAWLAVRHMDEDLMPVMERILALLGGMPARATTPAARACIVDQTDRMKALRCWYRTQRNVTAWVAGVHTYLGSSDQQERRKCRQLLHDMVLDEIDNARDLLALWESSSTSWMIISDVGETTFIYYRNLGELIQRKIDLMQGHEDDEPYVDPGFQWRVPGFSAEGSHA